MKRLTKLLSVILGIVIAIPAFGQSIIEYPSYLDNYLITNLGVDEGINGIQVHDFHQDSDGFLWIVSTRELFRYDGIRLKEFEKGNNGGTFYELHKDDLGRLQIPAFGGGIYTFENDSLIQHVEPSNETGKTLAISKSDTVFLGTYGNGLQKIFQDSVYQIYKQEDGLVGDEIWKLFIDSKNRLWIGTNKGLSLYENGRFVNFTTENGLPHNVVRSIAEVEKNSIWVGTAGGGIVVFRDDKPVKYYNSDNGLNGNMIYNISQNPADSSIWIGLHGEGGINRISKQGIDYFSEEDGLISSQINSIYFLDDGEISIGTEAGLSMLIPRKIDLVSSKEEGIFNFETVLVKQNVDNQIWIGSYNDGFRVFDGESWSKFESPPNITNGQTQSSTTGPNGDIWFGTQGSGIIQVINNKIEKKITTEDGLLDDYIRGLSFDDNGYLWVCTNSGINKIDPDFNITASYAEPELPNSFCTTLLKAQDNTIWAGTFGGGIVQFKDDSIHVFSEKDGLASNQILALYEDNKTNIWVGTLNNGLSVIQDREVINFKAESGLPQANYAGFKEDKYGNFWLATGNGIVRTLYADIDKYLSGDERLIPFQLFIKDDGMLIDNMQTANNSTIEELHTGELLFATTEGIVFIDPLRADFSNTKFAPYIDEIVVDGNVIEKGKEIELLPNQNKVQISYSALNFSAPHKTKFRTKLTGIDDDWILSEGRVSAYYDYLPDGEYEFNVSAVGPDGQWSDNVASLTFSVLPPFYKTWWFLALSILAFSGVLIGGMQIRSNIKVKRLNREISYQQKLFKEKERISRDLHDNVGSQITNLITGIEISTLHLQKKQPKEARKILSTLDIDARNAMTDLRETIWLLDKEEVTLKAFTQHLKAYLKRQEVYIEEIKVHLINDVEESYTLNPSQSLNLMRIIQEALNNCRKYAQASTFEITFSRSNDFLVVNLKDDGIGMDLDKAVETGNGLTNMQQRAEDIGATFSLKSSIGNGTDITIKT
jgi:signal transduction histidine kinase/ligand-binding sensor domain-containing protein